MLRWSRRMLVLAALAALIIGCERPPAPTGGVRPIDAAELDRVIAAHRGQVVVVDFWATWCTPCKQLFPHMVELEHRLAGRGLHVITVSLDETEKESDVRRFLASQNTASENFISRNGASQAAAIEFGLGGGIPFLKFYDRQGRPRPPIEGGYTDRIDQAIQQLLDET